MFYIRRPKFCKVQSESGFEKNKGKVQNASKCSGEVPRGPALLRADARGVRAPALGGLLHGRGRLRWPGLEKCGNISFYFVKALSDAAENNLLELQAGNLNMP